MLYNPHYNGYTILKRTRRIVVQMLRFRNAAIYLRTLRFLSMFRLGRNTWNELLDNQLMYNGEGTSNRYPYVFSSWMEYWRGLTETYHDEVKCAACGCKLTSCLSDDEIKAHNDGNPHDEIRRAVGGHVEIIKGCKLYYIVPLCNKCNQEGQQITLKRGTKIVPEFLARIKNG